MSGPPDDQPSKPPTGTPYKYVPRLTDDEAFGRSKRRLLVALIAAAIVLVLIAGYFLLQRFKTRAPSPVVSVQTLPATQWTTDPGLSITPAFCHDGNLVAYASDREGPGNFAIWLRPFRSSGALRRLTNEEFNDTDPDFSPDDSQLVYRSERDGGGIYILPVSGAGQPRLLAKGAMRPRFSPDGKWVAYYTVTSDAKATPFGAGRLYIVPPEGGAPKQPRPDFPYARYPVWLPGNLLLFEGSNDRGAADWWVTPIDGGDAIRTHTFEKLDRVSMHAPPERWDRNRILFSATREASLHLWEIGMEPRTWQASGTPRQVTSGDGIDKTADISPDGRVMFGTMRVTMDIWSLPLAGDPPKPAGALQRVTDDHALDQTPAVGINTGKMVYVSNKTGTRDIWVHDLKTGAEWSLTAYHRVNYRPVLSPDEKQVAYTTLTDRHCAIFIQGLDRESHRSTASGCFNIWDWSPDGANLLIYDPAEAAISAQLYKIDSGRRQPLLSRANWSVFDAAFSRDGKWIAFSAGGALSETELFVAPFHGVAIKEADWIPVTHGGGSLSAWSPDASVIYYQSLRDGFHCIWAQQLNGAKHPVGDPYAVQHLHSVAFGLYIIRPKDFHMTATKDRLVFNLTKETANLWLTDKP